MFRKQCFRCGLKAKKNYLIKLKVLNKNLSGYACSACFDIVDEQLNLTGKHPERPPV